MELINKARLILNEVIELGPEFIRQIVFIPERKTDPEQIKVVEAKLSAKFPPTFKKVIANYDLGKFEISYIQLFLEENHFIEGLLESNLNENCNPLLPVLKKHNLIVFGHYEGDQVTVSPENDMIYLLNHETQQVQPISTNLEVMILCGSILLKAFHNKECDVSQFVREIRKVEENEEAVNFWTLFAEMLFE